MKNKQKIRTLDTRDIDRIISMAWEDRTPFDAIKNQFNLDESSVIRLMRLELKPSSFKRWRKRVNGRKTKHLSLLKSKIVRFKSKSQRDISNNKISKSK
ncbi:MAG: TIGR03643 family protein [Flavobacteriales bacterium]|nr:TIGR03643 family protein [Flavobacteriales bacterium]